MTYHEYIFFVLLWIQDEIEGFITTFFCFIMLLANNYVSVYLSGKLNLNYYESLLFVDFVFFCLSFSLLSYKWGWIIVATMTLSFLLNLLPLVVDMGEYYSFFRTLYPAVNILLLEVLVGICFLQTIVYPKMKEWQIYLSQWSKEKWDS